MAQFVIRCPQTGMYVQIWLDDEDASTDKADTFEAVTYPACARVHLVNWVTHKLLGER
jgi:hypothetical protein